MVTSNILERTFGIRCEDGSTGTCFTIDVDERRYLVTARHVAERMRGGMVEISHEDTWISVPVRVVGHCAGDVDVSVLSPTYLFGGAGPLNPTLEDVTPCPRKSSSSDTPSA